MSIPLAVKYAKNADEMFAAESKISLLTNRDYDFNGAHTVIIYKMSTVPMNNYARNVGLNDNTDAQLSRFGRLVDLGASTEELLLKRDRSFIFNVDILDQEESGDVIEAAAALARELREVVIPEVDAYTYGVMVEKAGTKASVQALTKDNIYTAILAGSEALDNAEVPDTERVLMLTPAVYTLLKQSTVFDNTEVGADLRMKGVVGILDGMNVMRVPASRLPEGFGFLIAHPSATVAPVKLEDYNVHTDTVLSSGSIVTGRICYDAFVLDNKAKGIYYHPIAEKKAEQGTE